MGGFSLETLGSREHIMFYLQRKKQACKLGEGEINCRGGKQAGEGGNKLERRETNWRGGKQTGEGGNKLERGETSLRER